MTDQNKPVVNAFPTPLRFAQVSAIRETAIHSGGNPNIEYLLGVTKDGLVYRLDKNSQSWVKFGVDNVG